MLINKNERGSTKVTYIH